MPEARPQRVDAVDPDIREFHRIVNRDYALFSKNSDGSANARRLIAEKVRAPWRQGGPDMAETRETMLPSGVRIRIHTPARAAPGRALLYLHGGGWVMFSLDTHDRLMREYAGRSGTVVVGADYSLAPEARYPRALDDVLEALDWIAQGGLGVGYEDPKIILGGDSAGANLAVAAAMRARDEKRREADGLLLNYGAFDCEERGSHAIYDGDDYMLTRAEMAGFWDAYLGEDRSCSGPYARPLTGDLRGLPPAFMCIPECDILFDENIAMAEALRSGGAAVTDKVYSGATHSFLEAVSISSLAGRALDDAAAWLENIV
jgi:acetyl esterase